MRVRRVAVSALSAASLAVVLTACGGGQREDDGVDRRPVPVETAEQTAPPSVREDIIESGDGHVHDDLIDSQWEHEEEDEEHLHPHEDDEAEQEKWMEVAQQFGTLFTAVDKPHEQWLADLKPYVDERLYDIYSNPAVFSNIPAGNLLAVEVEVQGDTQQRILLTYDNPAANALIMVSLASGDNDLGWAVTGIGTP